MTVPLTRPAPVVVTPLDVDHAEFAAILHVTQLPHGFFARLGRPFLAGYYRGFVHSPHAIALIATVRQQPAGVLVGTLGHRAHYRWMLHDGGLRLATTALLGFLRKPHLAVRFMRTRCRRYLRGLLHLRDGGDGQQQSVRRRGPTAVLTHVAVVPESSGYGVGTVLVEAFLDEAALRGAPRARLSTLAGERGAGGFYRRLGWRHVAGGVDYDGRPIEIYATSTDPRER
jgi:GNAT superfamily N-acetyltransferase